MKKYSMKAVLCSTAMATMLNLASPSVQAAPMGSFFGSGDTKENSQGGYTSWVSAGIQNLSSKVYTGVRDGVSYVAKNPGQALTLFLAAQIPFSKGAVGDEFRVDGGGKSLRNWDVAGLMGSSSIVTWRARDSVTGVTKLYGRIISETGPTVDLNEFVLSENTAGFRGLSVTGVSSERRNFLLAWSADCPTSQTIYAKLFSGLGESLSNETAVAGCPSFSRLLNPHVSPINGGSGVALVWKEALFLSQAERYGEVYYTSLTAASPITNTAAATLINRDNSTSALSYVYGSELSDGNVATTFRTGRFGTNQNVFGRIGDASGAEIVPKFNLGVNQTNVQDAPIAAAFSDGKFLTVWSDLDSNFLYRFYSRAFSNDGTPLGAEHVINEVFFGEAERPGITVLGDRAVVVWSGPSSIAGRFLTSEGEPIGQEFNVGEPCLLAPEGPAITDLSNGSVVDRGVLVVWGCGSSELKGRILDVPLLESLAGLPVTTAQQTTAQQTTAEQTTALQTTAQQTTALQTTALQTTALQTTALQTTAQQTTAEQTTALQTTAQQTTAEQTTAEQTTAEQTTALQTTAQQTTDCDRNPAGKCRGPKDKDETTEAQQTTQGVVTTETAVTTEEPAITTDCERNAAGRCKGGGRGGNNKRDVAAEEDVAMLASSANRLMPAWLSAFESVANWFWGSAQQQN